MAAFSPLQDRAATAFFGYFPTWAMFYRDIQRQRSQTSQEERWVRQALDYLADLNGRSHEDLLGQYASVQSGSLASAGAATDLLHCYDDAFQAFYHRPSGAFPEE